MTDSHNRRRGDRFFGRLLGLFQRLFVTIGIGATILFIALLMTLSKVVHYTPPALPDRMILSYTFKPGLLEMVSKPSFSQPLLRPATTFHEIIDSLTQASADGRVQGFVARLEGVELSLAQIQELRDTLAKFRAAGKFAYVFAEEFGGFSSGMGDYYLASAFDQVWLQPVGAVSINGVAAEVPFLKGLMDKVGLGVDVSHKGVYKSAPESVTETGMTAPHREMMTGLINDLADQMIGGIAAARQLDAAALRRMVDGAPYADTEALDLKLVDKLGYYSQMLDAAKTRAGGGDIKTIGLLGYSFREDTINLKQGMPGWISKFARKANPPAADKDKSKIALIFGSGDIIPAQSQSQAAFGGSSMSADKIVAAFDEAQQDSAVAAVVFRIDTPGGSPGAAETIRRAIVEMRGKGRPVIVSMGGYAASGGYWVASAADKIVAEPATITGSIGVFGGKLVLAELWKKLGVNWDAVEAGDNARMWSSNIAFSAKEKARFDFLLGKIYDAFIDRVAEGRQLPRAKVEVVAEGHVWTGRQARERGLVDELGGLDRAVELAKAAAGLKPGQPVTVERFPGRKSTLELFIQLATEGAVQAPVVNIDAQSLAEGLKAAWGTEEAGALRAPRFELR